MSLNKRVTVNAVRWDMLKRIRGGAKFANGDDSSKYEMVGGMRLSEKKRGGKKKATPGA